MGNPNIAEAGKDTRFPANRQDHTQKGPYLVPLLKKFLEKTITYIDPETELKVRGKVKDAILWRLILNATQGDNEAIKEVINRFDGKVPQQTELTGQIDSGTRVIIIHPPKEENAQREDRPLHKAISI